MNDNLKKNNPVVLLLVGAAVIFVLLYLVIGYSGQVIIPLIKALLLAGGMLIYGFFLLGIFNGEEKTIEFSSAFAVGLIFTALFFYVASLFKILVPGVIVIFYTLPLLLLFSIIKSQKAKFQQTLKGFLNRSPLEYLVFSLPFIYALLPPSFYDTLVYHLGIPNLYLQHAGFIETPQFLYANTSTYYEISLIPIVYAGELVPRLFHFLVGIVFLFSAMDFAQDFFAVRRRKILLLLLVSMPMSVFLLSTVKNDIVGAFFIFLGIKYLLKKRIAFAALFWAFAVGVKYFNALFILILVIIFILRELGTKQKVTYLESGPNKDNKSILNFRSIVIFIVIFIAAILPLLVKNYIYAKNPFFPFLNGYFNAEYWDASRHALMTKDVGTMIYSFMDVVKFPYNLSFQELGFGGLVGVQFLVFLPFLLVVGERLKRKKLLLLFALLALFLGGFFTGSLRFLYIVFVIFSFYVGIVFESFEELPLISGRILKILFFLVITLNFLFSWGGARTNVSFLSIVVGEI